MGRVILGLVVLLLAIEVLNRALLLPRSKDLPRFRSYPQQAQALTEAPGLRLAFIGNSATECGVAPAVVEKELPARAGVFVADASEIHTWYYMTKNLFWAPQRRVDWLVIHFFTRMLDDAQVPEIGRLACFIVRPDDWAEVLENDVTTLSGRTDFLLSTFWSSYATRDRLRARVLRAVVPGYEDYVEAANAQQFRREHKAPAAAQTYKTLDRYLERAFENDTKVCFVAFPTLGKDGKSPAYEVDPDAERRIRTAGMAFLDLRQVPGLTPAHYRDDIHLVPAGAEIYTRHFVKAFAEVMKGQ